MACCLSLIHIFTEYMAEAEKLNAFCEGVLNQLQEKIDSNETVNGKE